MPKTRSDSYLYASTRIAIRSNRIFTKEKYDRLISAENQNDCFRILSEYGYIVPDGKERNENDVFVEEYKSLFSLIDEMAPEKEYFDIYKYPYDAQNLKALIKYEIRPALPKEKILMPLGSVNISDTENAVKTHDFAVFPKNLAKAANDAIETYAKTRDAQMIDIIIDKGCFDDMNDAAEKQGEPFCSAFRHFADMTNLRSFLRAVKMNKNSGFFNLIYVNGGNMPEKDFISAYENSAEKDALKILSDICKNSIYAKIFKKDISAYPLYKIETLFENIYFEYLSSRKNDIFGPSPMIYYIFAKQNEIKNARVIISAKKNGLQNDKIRERIYV